MAKEIQKENMWWQGYPGITPQDYPVVSVFNRSQGKYIPFNTLNSDQQLQVKKRVGEVISSAIQQQINIYTARPTA